MRGLLILLALSACAGGSDGEERVDRFTACWTVSTVYCNHLYECVSPDETAYAECVDAAARACCGGEVCPEEASPFTVDELDVCVAAVEDLSCTAWAGGYVPASCQ